jgi:replicative DNA helicase
MLSDLRESGAIEQDADIVTFIYRPEYYKIYEWDNGDDSRSQGEIVIAKHRNGALENVRLKFIAEFAKFSDIDYVEDFSSGIHGESMISTVSSSMNNDNDAPF